MNNYSLKANESILQELTLPDTKLSWQSRFFNSLLRLLPIKKRTASAEAVQKRVRKLILHPPSHAPKKLGKGITVTLQQVSGWPVYYTSPATGNKSPHYVVFLHGGGYINEIVPAHWKIIGTLTRNTGMHSIVPIYPLAPTGTAKTVVPVVGELIGKLIKDKGSANVTILGNSAGAGMGLAAAQWLRDNGYPQPKQLILISPGLDATLSHPVQKQLSISDPLQDIPGIREGIRLYAGELDITHPYVSPLRSDLHNLSPIIIFSGTLDLLYPDSVELTKKARAAGVQVELYLKPRQIHNYVAMPTPEGREAMAIITKAIGGV